jgi:hypothetical protein
MKLKIADRFINSFFPHDSLNPSIYNEGGKMKPAVHQAIMLVIEEFLDTIEYDLAISDIESVLLTGSLANYNYNKWSDADLHLLVDYSKFDEDKKFVRDYLRSKAINWNDRHKVTIYGHEIEIYFQDVNEPHHSTGIYNVTKDRWSVEPKKIDNKDVIDENLPLAFNKADYISIEIDKLASRQDDATIEKIDILKDKIKKMRRSGLERDGEYSIENIAFKILRRRGDLKLLHQAARIIADKNLSIPKILDEDQEWWKKRRSLDNKNYRELLGYSGKKSTFKRKYASKKTGYPKSANRRKIAKSGKPYMHNPRLKLGISAPPGVMQEREIAPTKEAEKGTFSILRALSNNTKIRDRVISNVIKNTNQKFLMLRKERRFATEKCLKGHSYEFVRSPGGWRMRLVDDINKIKHPDNILIDPKECLYNQGRPMDLDEMGLINILDDELETGRAVEIKTDNALSYHVPGFSTVVAIADKPAKKKKVVTPKPTPVGPSLLHQKLSAEKRYIAMQIWPKKDFWFTNFSELVPSIHELPSLANLPAWGDLIAKVAGKLSMVSYSSGGKYIFRFDAAKNLAKVQRDHASGVKERILDSIREDANLNVVQKKLYVAAARAAMASGYPKWNTKFSKKEFLTKFDSETNNKICEEYIDCNKSVIVFIDETGQTDEISINKYLQGVDPGALRKIKRKEEPKKPFVPRPNKLIFLDLLRSEHGRVQYKDERQIQMKTFKTFQPVKGGQMQRLDPGLYKAIEQMDPKVRKGVIQSWIKNEDQKTKVKAWHNTKNIKDKICKGKDLTDKDRKTMPDLPYSEDGYGVPLKCPSGRIWEEYPSNVTVGSVFMSGRAFKVGEEAQAWLKANGSKFGVVPVPDKKNTWYMPVAHAKYWQEKWDPDADYSESPTELIVPHDKASELSPGLSTELAKLAKLAKLVFNGPAKIYIKSGVADRGTNHPTGDAADIRILTEAGIQSAQDTYAFLIAAIKSGKVKDGGVGYYANNVGYYNKAKMDANSEYPHYDLTGKGPRKWFWFKCKKDEVASCKASVDPRGKYFKKRVTKIKSPEEFQTREVPMSAVQVASEGNPLGLPTDVYDKIAKYSEAIAKIDSGTTA